MKLAFRCRSCHHSPMRLKVDRPGILQTILELFCPECGATFRPSLMWETDNLEIKADGQDQINQ